MTMGRAYRAFAVIGIAGAIISIIANLLRWVSPDDFLVRNLASAIGLNLLVFGFFSSYLVLSSKLGRYGLISFIVGLLGMLWICCLVWGVAFFGPVLQGLDHTFTSHKPIPEMTPPLSSGFLSAVLLQGVGMILYGIALMLSRTALRWPGLLLIVGSVLGFVMVAGIDVLGPILENLAFIWLCKQVLQDGESEAS
ncbi:hypothetical protein [Paenibacillus cremeus]|uniref:DUF4386 family protein n=1 Tax=Paenibacillus cremeus TaxID=2163881 RepID=A0A559JZV4_9BACL|nr:hypothetical protein [Paenibacillus cremeus]TVY05413.1 hypothetical protein FPZ49_30290 [Paenibacillus cremeus]